MFVEFLRGRGGAILNDKRIEWSDGTSSTRMGSTWFSSDGSSVQIVEPSRRAVPTQK